MDNATTWTDVVVPLAAVAFGGVVVALLTSRSARNQHLREQMLAAAQDFLSAGATAMVQLRDAMRGGAQQRLAGAEAQIVKLGALTPRLSLLFHPNSETAREAADAAAALRRTHTALVVSTAAGTPTSDDALSALDEARIALDRVAATAWKAIGNPRRHWRQRAPTAKERLAFLDLEVDFYREIARAQLARERAQTAETARAPERVTRRRWWRG